MLTALDSDAEMVGRRCLGFLNSSLGHCLEVLPVNHSQSVVYCITVIT